MVRYEGKIIYKDEEEIRFEINEDSKVKFEIIGELRFEPIDHLKVIQRAIEATKELLKSASPMKFEMEEINSE